MSVIINKPYHIPVLCDIAEAKDLNVLLPLEILPEDAVEEDDSAFDLQHGRQPIFSSLGGGGAWLGPLLQILQEICNWAPTQ